MRVTDEPLIGPLHLRVIYVLRSASVTLVQRKKQKDKKKIPKYDFTSGLPEMDRIFTGFAFLCCEIYP